TACNYGNACGAIVVSRHGCAPAMPSWDELQMFLDDQRGRPFRLREDETLEQRHWADTRTGSWPQLTILAMDHRSQFEALCSATGASPERISAFKSLALRAVDAVANGNTELGVLLDGQHVLRGLVAAADYPYCTGRP